MTRVVLILVAATLCGACTKLVKEVPNTARAAVLIEGASGHFQACLEYSTAASVLTEREAKAKADVLQKVTAELSYRSAESLAQIYSVSEIMQFGHAAMYRLCEAAANGMLTPERYEARLTRLLSDMKHLLFIQASNSIDNLIAQGEELRAGLSIKLEQRKALVAQRAEKASNTSLEQKIADLDAQIVADYELASGIAATLRSKELQGELEKIKGEVFTTPR